MAYRVEVFESEIQGMFAMSGEVGREAQFTAREITVAAEAIVPRGAVPRGDTLSGQHRTRFVPASFGYGFRFYVENTSGHAEWVHEGVDGIIYPWGKVLVLHLPGGSVKARFVRGQGSQPWLREAAEGVLFGKYGRS